MHDEQQVAQTQARTNNRDQDNRTSTKEWLILGLMIATVVSIIMGITGFLVINHFNKKMKELETKTSVTAEVKEFLGSSNATSGATVTNSPATMVSNITPVVVVTNVVIETTPSQTVLEGIPYEHCDGEVEYEGFVKHAFTNPITGSIETGVVKTTSRTSFRRGYGPNGPSQVQQPITAVVTTAPQVITVTTMVQSTSAPAVPSPVSPVVVVPASAGSQYGVNPTPKQPNGYWSNPNASDWNKPAFDIGGPAFHIGGKKSK